jgi:hypothetical protein
MVGVRLRGTADIGGGSPLRARNCGKDREISAEEEEEEKGGARGYQMLSLLFDIHFIIVPEESDLICIYYQYEVARRPRATSGKLKKQAFS